MTKTHKTIAGTNIMTNEQQETAGLTMLGNKQKYQFSEPSIDILEAFPNKFPERNYVICFEHPEFTSLCPMTGQPDFGTIRLTYVPGEKCVESKSFKLYMAAFRNHGSFMESITNIIANDMVEKLAPRRLTLEGIFNVRGGTAINVRVEHLDEKLSAEEKNSLLRLWYIVYFIVKKQKPFAKVKGFVVIDLDNHFQLTI